MIVSNCLRGRGKMVWNHSEFDISKCDLEIICAEFFCFTNPNYVTPGE
jgi:hypothetical protein